jgi:hypothetical protein
VGCDTPALTNSRMFLLVASALPEELRRTAPLFSLLHCFLGCLSGQEVVRMYFLLDEVAVWDFTCCATFSMTVLVCLQV